VGHGPAGAASATYRPDVVAALGFRWAVLARRPGNAWLSGMRRGAPRCTLVARSGKDAVIPGVLPSSVRRTSCGWCSTPGAAQRCDRAAAALLTAGQTCAPPPAATGRFVARLFVREDTWLVGAACDPSGCRAVVPDRRRGGRAEGGSGWAGLGATVWVRSGRAAPGRPWVCRPGFDRRGRAGRSRWRRSRPWRLRPGRSGSHHGGPASGPRGRCRGPR